MIFDLDGVLVDSFPVHAEAYRRLCAEHGVEFGPEAYRAFSGKPRRAVLTAVLGPALPDFDHRLPELMADKVRRMEDVLAEGGLQPLPGARELLLALRERGTPYAIATTSRTPELLLEGAGLAPLVQHVACGRDVARSKPAPDVYLAALALLGADPSTAVALEDTPLGIAAAQAAGLATHAVSTTRPARDLSAAEGVWPDVAAFAEGVLGLGF